MSNTPPCCPIERLVRHSAEHFIAPESFEQLAARRADNLDLMTRFLETLAARAQNDDTRNPVNRAIDSLIEARGHLRQAEAMAAGR